MKHLTRLLTILLALTLLASCTPATDTAPSQGSGSLQSNDPDALASQPTERLSSEPAASSGDDAAPSPTPTAPPEGTASDEAGASSSAAPDPHAEHEAAILAAMENLDPESFLWKYEFFLVRDDAGTEYIGHLLCEYEQTLHAAEYPGAEDPLFTVDAFTDENGEWRSGEHGSGVDAETADYYLNTLRAFLEPDEDADPAAPPPVDMLHPIAGMTFNYDSGILLRSYPYSDYGSSHNLIYIEAAAPDAESFDPPIQLLYSLEHMGGTGFSCVLLAYNEGYGWSTLDG